MEVLEAITIVHGVAKLAYLLGTTLYNVAKNARNQRGVLDAVEQEILPLQTFIGLVESVQLSIALSCPKDEDSPVVRFIKTEGVLDGLRKQSQELETHIQLHLNSLTASQVDSASGLNFSRRFLAAWKWKTRQIPSLEKVHARIERLKTTLQLVMTIIHFEALSTQGKAVVQIHGNCPESEETKALRDEIRRLREDMRYWNDRPGLWSDDELQLGSDSPPIPDLSPSHPLVRRLLPSPGSSVSSFETAREASPPHTPLTDNPFDTELPRRSTESYDTLWSFVTVDTHATAESYFPSVPLLRMEHAGDTFSYSLLEGRTSNASFVTAHSRYVDPLDILAKSIIECGNVPIVLGSTENRPAEASRPRLRPSSSPRRSYSARLHPASLIQKVKREAPDFSKLGIPRNNAEGYPRPRPTKMLIKEYPSYRPPRRSCWEWEGPDECQTKHGFEPSWSPVAHQDHKDMDLFPARRPSSSLNQEITHWDSDSKDAAPAEESVVDTDTFDSTNITAFTSAQRSWERDAYDMAPVCPDGPLVGV